MENLYTGRHQLGNINCVASNDRFLLKNGFIHNNRIINLVWDLVKGLVECLGLDVGVGVYLFYWDLFLLLN